MKTLSIQEKRQFSTAWDVYLLQFAVLCLISLVVSIPLSVSAKTLVQDMGLSGGLAEWSPNGQKIAYVSTAGSRNGMSTNIWVMNADGSGKKLLTGNKSWDSYPAWSPDGSKIIYSSHLNGKSSNRQLWIMNSRDGSNKRQLTRLSTSAAYPQFSPNEREITFVSGDNRIWKMKADGSNPQQLSHVQSTQPYWSSDGRSIIYAQYDAKTRYDIWVMDADGNNPRPISLESHQESHPRLSSDGSMITFEVWDMKAKSRRIWTMNADGTNKRPLETGGREDGMPRWSPNGKSILFNSWNQKEQNRLCVTTAPTPPIQPRSLPKPVLLASIETQNKTNYVSKGYKKTENRRNTTAKTFAKTTTNNAPNKSFDNKTTVQQVLLCRQFLPEMQRIRHQSKSFKSDDKTVWICVVFSGIAKPFRLRAKFFKPDSYKYYEQVTDWNFASPRTSQTIIDGAFMTIKGSPAETISGNWTVTLEIQEQGGKFVALKIPKSNTNRISFSLSN